MSKIAIDFDGVLHSYDKFEDPPRGKPVRGVYFALKRLTSLGYQLVVFTARPLPGVVEWLDFHDMRAFFVQVTNRKTPDIVAFFDDRGWHVECNQPNGLAHAVDLFLEAQAPDGPAVTVAALLPQQQRLTP